MSGLFFKLSEPKFKLLELGVSEIDFSLEEVVMNVHLFELIEYFEFLK